MKTFDNISLLPYNTFGIDVCARRLYEFTVQEMPPMPDGPFFILGGGSDVVFTADYQGTILHPIPSFQPQLTRVGQHVQVLADAAMPLDALVDYCISHQAYGLENLSAIPGTVGAAVVQNVGAYGLEIKDVLLDVTSTNLLTSATHCRTAIQCQLAYRTSIFKQQQLPELITHVRLTLSATYQPNLTYAALRNLPHDTAQQMRQSIVDMRWAKLPRPEQHGSAGSFFKNPVVDDQLCQQLLQQYPDMPVHAAPADEKSRHKLSAAWLIDRAGWKGRTCGAVGVWPSQPLVLYNLGGCTGTEVVQLARAIIHSVQQRFGITLQPEAIIV